MTARSGESGMDYDWQNGTGPVDPNSPWSAALRKNTPFAHSKRTRSDFESPSKSISTANIPQLRPAAGQTTFLSRFSSSPDKPLPPPPSKEIDIAAFRTPSKAPAFDFTSGDDTPEEKSLKRGPGGFHVSDTPDADSEATPEQIYQRNARSRIDTSPSKTIQDAKRDRTRSPKKRTSLLTKLWSSPSRGKDMLTPYSNKVEKRIQRKRAEKTRIKNTRSNTYNSDSETDASRRKDTQDKKASGPVHGFMTSWLGLIENHPNAPSILITYLQLLTNFIFMCVILYGAWSFWMTIKRDVDQGVHEAASAVLIEVRQCKDDWEQFRCEARPERTRELCDGLAKCLAKNPEQIARAQVSAKTFAKIANDFAEHLSYKAVLVYVTGFSSVWFFMNFTLNSLRNHIVPNHAPPQHSNYYGPPATPFRHASQGQLQYGTPYQPNASYSGYQSMQMMDQQHAGMGTSQEKNLIDL